MKRILPLLALIGSAFPAMAHPDNIHGEPSFSVSAGFLHPLGGVDHLLVMLAIGLWAFRMRGGAPMLLPFAFLASMACAASLGLLGIHSAAIEHGILASVVLAGLAIALSWNPGTGIAATFSAFSGFFHGMAHGAEMPSGTLPLQYLAGMIAATALLLSLGLGIGGVLGKVVGDASATRLRFRRAIRNDDDL